MTSMTGFGHGEHRDSRVQMVLEIRSYNNRYLELFINLPYSMKQLEPLVREYLSARIQRGKVEFYLSVMELEDSSDVVVDHARVTTYLTALDELRRVSGLKERPSLSQLMNLEGVLKTVSRKDPEALWGLVTPCWQKYLPTSTLPGPWKAENRGGHQEMRPGDPHGLATIESHVPEIEAKIRTGLAERFRELLGEGVDESRIMAETAVQLMRADINEEVQRMKAHLESLDDALGRQGPQGKRLDFVCQELGREINTIGSKSMLLEIDQAVIAVKDSLEKIREQLRNVE